MSEIINYGEIISIEYNKPLENYIAKIRVLNSKQYNLSTIFAFPKNPNLKIMPVKGEIVYIYKAPSHFSSSSVNLQRYYFDSAVNIINDVNNNIKPGSSQIKSSNSDSRKILSTELGYDEEEIDTDEEYENEFDNRQVKQLQLFEGDITLEGRYGNSIRISSTQKDLSKYEVQPDWFGETPTDPIIIINNGQVTTVDSKRYKEVLHKDSSNIWLTSTQKIKNEFIYNLKSLDDEYKRFSEYQNSQAIINASRVILNAGSDNIFLLSKQRISLSSDKSVHIDAGNFVLNATKSQFGYEAKEPAVLGIQLERALEDVIDASLTIIDVLTSSFTTTNGGAPAPSNAAYFTKAKTKLTKLRSHLEEIQSTINFVK